MKPYQLASVFIVFLVLVALCIWQLQRHAWKQEIIQDYERVRQHKAFVIKTANDLPLIYQDVLLSGTVDKAHRFFFQAPPKNGKPGVFVVLPVSLAAGETVFVFAGWLAEDQKENFQVLSKNRFQGIVVPVWSSNSYTPKNDVEDNHWFKMDFAEMCLAMGCKKYYPNLVHLQDKISRSIHPQPLSIDFHNHHLQYAATWFSLAIALIGIVVLFYKRKDNK